MLQHIMKSHCSKKVGWLKNVKHKDPVHKEVDGRDTVKRHNGVEVYMR